MLAVIMLSFLFIFQTVHSQGLSRFRDRLKPNQPKPTTTPETANPEAPNPETPSLNQTLDKIVESEMKKNTGLPVLDGTTQVQDVIKGNVVGDIIAPGTHQLGQGTCCPLQESVGSDGVICYRCPDKGDPKLCWVENKSIHRAMVHPDQPQRIIITSPAC